MSQSIEISKVDFSPLISELKVIFGDIQSNEIMSAAGRDIKSLADQLAEKAILKFLKGVLDIPVLTEESGVIGEFETSGLRWVIDPLDGTVNFTRGLPLFCTSIALWKGDTPVFGLIYDIPNSVEYKGIVGEGFWINGERASVSSTHESKQAILTTGFPVNRDFESDSLKQFITRIQDFKKIRLLGSAALSLSTVASGKTDAYSEENIMFWDVAAGLALVKAAGGDIWFRKGSKEHSLDVVATNGLVELNF